MATPEELEARIVALEEAIAKLIEPEAEEEKPAEEEEMMEDKKEDEKMASIEAKLSNLTELIEKIPVVEKLSREKMEVDQRTKDEYIMNLPISEQIKLKNLK